MLFFIALLPILNLTSASNLSKRFEGNKQIRLASTGKCLDELKIELDNDDVKSLPQNYQAGMELSGFGLAECNKEATIWKVLEGDTKRIQISEKDNRGGFLDAGLPFDENPDNLIFEKYGRSERLSQQLEHTDQGRFVVMSETEPKYCLSRVDLPKVYIRTALCEDVPADKEGPIKQIWEIIEPPPGPTAYIDQGRG